MEYYNRALFIKCPCCVDKKFEGDDYQAIDQVSLLLKEKYGIAHLTLQIENLQLNPLDEPYVHKLT
ncbi:hypothetical protein JMUB7498_26630 [Staphylococcus aureus]